MSKVFKVGALWLIVATMVWLVTLWRWQTGGHEVSDTDIVGQLFVLPLVLTAVMVLALWGAAKLRDKSSSPLPVGSGVAAGVDGQAKVAADSGTSDARRFSVAVLDASVHCSAGAGAAQALMQMRTGDIRPQLDEELQDFDGAPVFTARVPELDVESLRERLRDEVSDRVVRVLALLQRPVDQLFNRVDEITQEWIAQAGPESLPAQPDQFDLSTMKAHLSGMAPSTSNRPATVRRLPRLTVRLAVPSAWSESEREHLTAWLRMRCQTLCDEPGALHTEAPECHAHAVDQGNALWAMLDQQMLQWSRETTPQWTALLVADSAIDLAEVERRQAVGALFTAANQRGRIPGEAAAALLLATPGWPGLEDMVPAPVRLFRSARLQRDKSADAAGRVGPATLQEALRQALEVCGASEVDPTLVVSDGDHRASRTAELFEALQAVSPGLDPTLAVVRVGEACGDLGLAGALMPVALAAACLQHEDDGGLTMAVNVQPSHDRMAVALLPWTWTSSSAQATH